jgi:hypothetical protein
MSAMAWLSREEMVALGWTLLHFCWQSTVIALLYALVDRCLVRATTAVRYGIAMAMLGLMPVAAVATFVEQERLVVVHHAQAEQPVMASRVGSLHATVATAVPFAAPVMADGELWIAGHANRLMPWIDGIWLVGVCLLALRAAIAVGASQCAIDRPACDTEELCKSSRAVAPRASRGTPDIGGGDLTDGNGNMAHVGDSAVERGDVASGGTTGGCTRT